MLSCRTRTWKGDLWHYNCALTIVHTHNGQWACSANDSLFACRRLICMQSSHYHYNHFIVYNVYNGETFRLHKCIWCKVCKCIPVINFISYVKLFCIRNLDSAQQMLLNAAISELQLYGQYTISNDCQCEKAVPKIASVNIWFLLPKV